MDLWLALQIPSIVGNETALKLNVSRAPVAHACNTSYLEDWDWEDCSSRPAWAKSSQDPISKITGVKWTRGEAQTVECLLCKFTALISNPSPTEKKQKQNKTECDRSWGCGSLILPTIGKVLDLIPRTQKMNRKQSWMWC
jgi:hypothetical protein